jgi:hypothetical protein
VTVAVSSVIEIGFTTSSQSVIDTSTASSGPITPSGPASVTQNQAVTVTLVVQDKSKTGAIVGSALGGNYWDRVPLWLQCSDTVAPSIRCNFVPIETVTFTYGTVRGGRGVTMQQFPATLAYAMTDFRSQGRTFHRVIVNLKKPTVRGCFASPSNPVYVLCTIIPF